MNDGLLRLGVNGCGGFGRYLPSIVVVAPGEPGVPVVCWALALRAVNGISKRAASRKRELIRRCRLEALIIG